MYLISCFPHDYKDQYSGREERLGLSRLTPHQRIRQDPNCDAQCSHFQDSAGIQYSSILLCSEVIH